jgi:hypothetical protein
MVTSGPVGDGLADGDALADVDALAGAPDEAVPLPAGLMMVVVLVVQAVSASASAAATPATPEIVLVRLMSPPFPAT